MSDYASMLNMYTPGWQGGAYQQNMGIDPNQQLLMLMQQQQAANTQQNNLGVAGAGASNLLPVQGAAPGVQGYDQWLASMQTQNGQPSGRPSPATVAPQAYTTSPGGTPQTPGATYNGVDLAAIQQQQQQQQQQNQASIGATGAETGITGPGGAPAGTPPGTPPAGGGGSPAAYGGSTSFLPMSSFGGQSGYGDTNPYGAAGYSQIQALMQNANSNMNGSANAIGALQGQATAPIATQNVGLGLTKPVSTPTYNTGAISSVNGQNTYAANPAALGQAGPITSQYNAPTSGPNYGNVDTNVAARSVNGPSYDVGNINPGQLSNSYTAGAAPNYGQVSGAYQAPGAMASQQAGGDYLNGLNGMVNNSVNAFTQPGQNAAQTAAGYNPTSFVNDFLSQTPALQGLAQTQTDSEIQNMRNLVNQSTGQVASQFAGLGSLYSGAAMNAANTAAANVGAASAESINNRNASMLNSLYGNTMQGTLSNQQTGLGAQMQAQGLVSQGVGQQASAAANLGQTGTNLALGNASNANNMNQFAQTMGAQAGSQALQQSGANASNALQNYAQTQSAQQQQASLGLQAQGQNAANQLSAYTARNNAARDISSLQQGAQVANQSAGLQAAGLNQGAQTTNAGNALSAWNATQNAAQAAAASGQSAQGQNTANQLAYWNAQQNAGQNQASLNLQANNQNNANNVAAYQAYQNSLAARQGLQQSAETTNAGNALTASQANAANALTAAQSNQGSAQNYAGVLASLYGNQAGTYNNAMNVYGNYANPMVSYIPSSGEQTANGITDFLSSILGGLGGLFTPRA